LKSHSTRSARPRRRNPGFQLERPEVRPLLATITEYPVPGGTTSLGNSLFGVIGGPDGNVFFTDTLDNAIGQFDPSGNIHKKHKTLRYPRAIRS
jgi:streptogramin lyase